MLDEGSGLGRRKPQRRTPAERAAIVAEAYKPGATVAGVARRHGIVASQLSGWRTAFHSPQFFGVIWPDIKAFQHCRSYTGSGTKRVS
ncbi:MAG: transposase [Marinovum sp.]|nr:transposase [Marinovum sp.]